MSLTPGTRLGPYEIIAPIGAGGMGEVYRAKDTKLDRDVAVKVLPESFALDAERVARFTREAKTLASLNHPNIAAIYGIEEQGNTRALVMELVEGDDLSALIARFAGPNGPALQLDDVLAIARQIADALEAAHEQGIVHRDLKPANIKIRTDGTVKVLDFGLAKALDRTLDSGPGTRDAMNSPTLTARATQMGMIIGTAAYMAPEQAKGRVVDRRADVWAFGVVLYEMLTGKRAFAGDDITEVLASVLKTDPDWTSVPDSTPPAVRRLLRRCLEKDPRRRLSSIGDARLELDEKEPAAPAAVTSGVAAVAARPPRLSRLWPAIAGVVITAAIAWLMWPTTGISGALMRTSVLQTGGEPLYPDSTGVAISPDGTMIAFVTGNVQTSDAQLWVRALDSMTPRKIEGGEGALLPFWSPDGRRIGFFTNNKLKTVAASGGRADVLCDTPNGRGASWSKNNIILFAPDAVGGIYRIPATGGTPEPVTALDTARKEIGHRFPFLLPDGDHFLYAVLPGKEGRFEIYAGSMKGSTPTHIASMESAPKYAEPGWLLYSRQGALSAVPFDATALKITGDPVSLDDQPTSILNSNGSWTAATAASLSATGTLAYFSGSSANTSVVWLDAAGRVTGRIPLPAGFYDALRISPDGTQTIVQRSVSPSESSLWLVDLARNSFVPASSGRGRNEYPLWSPDGQRIVITSDRDGSQDLYMRTIGDGAPEKLFYRSPVMFNGAVSWSRDGRWLLLNPMEAETAQNIVAIPAAGGEIIPVARGPLRDLGGQFSPDARWIAYLSEDTGRFEVVVQSFPTPGRPVQVSQSGASSVWWSADGRALVYAGSEQGGLWHVDVNPGADFRVGTPKQIGTLPAGTTDIDAVPDLQKFIAIVPERTGPGSITLVHNWRKALEKK